MIEITKELYVELRIASEKLNLLEAGGVDDWEWYHASLHPEDGDSINTIKKAILEDAKLLDR